MRRTAGVFAFCLVCSLLGFGLAPDAMAAGRAPGSTADAPPAVSITPSSGPAGTTITVSGSGCPQEGWGVFTWQVHVQVGHNGAALAPGSITDPDGAAANGEATFFTQEGYPGRVDADTTPDQSGNWSVQLKIPTSGDSFPATPGTYPVSALCYAKEGTNVGRVQYADAGFDVTGERLARTGRTHIGYELLASIALIAVGTALVLRSRRTVNVTT